MLRLVEAMAKGYINRSAELEGVDIQGEQDHNWFLSQKWVGMALYTNGFAALTYCGSTLSLFSGKKSAPPARTSAMRI